MEKGAILLLVLALVGCATRPSGSKSPPQPLSAAQFGKADIDRVAEAHERDLQASLRLLAEKLYKRNPKEWRRGGWSGPEEPIERLFGKQHNWRFPELEGLFGSDAVQLALKPAYNGDRIFAFIAGLGGMVLTAFNGRYEFFMTDDLDAQKLYNAARNIEIAAWKLANDRGSDGQPLLVSNEMGAVANLSFEREIGKMIGNLDMLSNIIADKNNRTAVKVIQNMATAVFLPIAGLK
jgi:hypothetical protein